MITNKIHEKSEEYFEFLDLPVYPSVVHAAMCDEETCRAVLQHNDAVFLFFASAAHIAVRKRPPHNVSAETSDFGSRNSPHVVVNRRSATKFLTFSCRDSWSVAIGRRAGQVTGCARLLAIDKEY